MADWSILGTTLFMFFLLVATAVSNGVKNSIASKTSAWISSAVTKMIPEPTSQLSIFTKALPFLDVFCTIATFYQSLIFLMIIIQGREPQLIYYVNFVIGISILVTSSYLNTKRSVRYKVDTETSLLLGMMIFLDVMSDEKELERLTWVKQERLMSSEEEKQLEAQMWLSAMKSGWMATIKQDKYWAKYLLELEKQREDGKARSSSDSKDSAKKIA
jgi:hypothetical protein